MKTCWKNPCSTNIHVLFFTKLHDNTHSHTGKATLGYLTTKKIKVLPHPPYSSDLAPCNFWLFPKLKEQLRNPYFPQMWCDLRNHTQSRKTSFWEKLIWSCCGGKYQLWVLNGNVYRVSQITFLSKFRTNSSNLYCVTVKYIRKVHKKSVLFLNLVYMRAPLTCCTVRLHLAHG